MAITKAKKLKLTDPSLVYYGPYSCKDSLHVSSRKKGNTGCNARIVKAGNGAHPDLEFDFPEEGVAYPNWVFIPHVCAEHH